MRNIKIPCSPEVRELNEAVETADMLTDYRFDTVSAADLVDILAEMQCPWHAADLQGKAESVELVENGRSLFDRMQRNLSVIVSATDSELAAFPDAMAEMFGENTTPEDRRIEARNTQDKLDRQGREAFAQSYAQEQQKNLRQ